ncbi:universal stress protein family protein [Krasilnikovia cinnamomea]|uniref:Universal stress protein family protein n=1 Tax=Krasilnikovia cinnamomea TaxID=349313 RepID=A0A4Q7ZTN3_9ACTN|nr:universal stress protein [Krasilnikovia cinnamomea]RZU54608.1 universal stress protein family protein [Krasilnikovia cinnamomea]
MNAGAATAVRAPHDTRPNATATEILAELRHRFAELPVSYDATPEGAVAVPGETAPTGCRVVGAHLAGAATHERCPVLVYGPDSPGAGRAVVAAVDDDSCPGCVIAYAAAEARRQEVPLRAVYAWTEAEADLAEGYRLSRHDRISDADRLLTSILYDHLPADAADEVERQILHDTDPAHALVSLSQEASLLVVAAGSHHAGEALGHIPRALLGRTACPLAVLPTGGPQAPYPDVG